MVNTNRTLLELRQAMVEDMKLNPGLINDGERTRFLNRALLDLGDMLLFEKLSEGIAHVTGVVAFPDDFASVSYIEIAGRRLSSMPDTTYIMAGDDPIGYIQKSNSFVLYPKPTTDGTVDLCYIYRPASMVLDGDRPDIPNGQDELLIDYAVGMCHRKNGNNGVAREYMGYYNTGKAGLQLQLVTQLNSRILTIKTSEVTPSRPPDILV